MKFKSNRFLATLVSGAIICATMCISASAADNYEENTTISDLTKSYTVTTPVEYNDSSLGTITRARTLSYKPNSVSATTRFQVGTASNLTAKAYVAIQQHEGVAGSGRGEFIQSSSNYIGNDGYISAKKNGTSYCAKYVLHSGSSNILFNWRFDNKYLDPRW